MVKERKIAFGSSNLNTSSVLTVSSTTSVRSNTHKLITPSTFNLPKSSTAHQRKIDDASSFRPGKIYVRDFRTAYHDEFQNPASLAVVEYGVDAEEAQRKWHESRQVARLESLRKLGVLAKGKFGNMANMMRAFKKNTGDSISIVEFAEHLRRRNLDAVFPSDDQDMLFEALKAAEPGADLPTVGDMLKLINEADPSYTTKDTSSDMIEMRDFLADQIANRQQAKSREGEKHYSREEEHAELMRKAVGQKTFGITIKAEDMDTLVSDLNKQEHKNQTHAKFSRFLRLTNMKLHAAPFYDMRNDPLEHRKHHVVDLSDRAASNLLTLSASKERERDALDVVLNRSITLSEMHKKKFSSDLGVGSGKGGLSHSQSVPSLRSGGLSQYSAPEPETQSAGAGPDKEPSFSSSSSSARGGMLSNRPFPMSAAATPITKGGVAPIMRNLAGHVDEAGGLEAAARLTLGLNSYSSSSTPSSPSSPEPALRPSATSPEQPSILSSPLGGGSFFSPAPQDFIDQRMRLQKPHTPESHVGKGNTGGLGPSRVTDWHRIGHGGDVLTPRNVKALSGTEGEYRGRYHTTNADYYPPLIYQPSMPVTRELVSDADMRDAMKASRRQRRHLRLTENLSVTQRRLEHQQLEADARETRRCQKVNDDMINYSTTVFLNDLKRFKKQPLQMMMKKPNLTKSDHMWGGNLGRSAKGQEIRDFTTTYSGSFASPEKLGKIVPTLVLEDRISAIFGNKFD